MAAANNEKYGTLGKVAAGSAAELAKTKKLADGLEKRKIRDKGKVVMYSDAPPLQKSSTPSLRVVSDKPEKKEKEDTVWVEKMSRSTGKVYYVNLITKETRWIKPTEDHTAPQPTSKKEEGKKDYWEKKWKNDFQKWKSTNGAIAAAVSLEEMERKEKAEEYKKRQLEEEKEARRAKKFRPDDD
jgi:hypothetical protein